MGLASGKSGDARMRVRSIAAIVLALVMGPAFGACSGDDAEAASGAGSGGGTSGAGGPPGAGSGVDAGGTGGRSGARAGSGASGSGGRDGSGGRSGASGSAGAAATGDCGNAQHQIFPPGAAWNTPIAGNAAIAADSDAIIDHLQSVHTDQRRFQIDFSLRVLRADASTPHRAFEPNSDFYETECDTAPPPVPVDGSLEGEDTYECTSDGDCHLIVLDTAECRLFEMWRANIDGDAFAGGCQAVWEVDRVYPDSGRGLYCSSADAAGLPIAPLLFSADEVAAGAIPHALRFALPNDLIRNARFVAPGTHATRSASGGGDTPPYAARLRLKQDTDLGELGPAARVVAEALRKYGMYLADGGNLTFMGEDERDTASSWDDVGLGPHDLKPLQWSDFEVVDSGPALEWDGDCEREVITR